jgi:predicted PurR-regulated permease PerM
VFISAVKAAVFIFVVAALIAILLNPIVRAFTRFRLPRPLAVATVYVAFAAILAAIAVVVATVVANQVQDVSSLVQKELTVQPGQTGTPAEHKIAHLQHWLNAHNLGRIHIKQLGNEVSQRVQTLDVKQYTGRAVDITKGVVVGVFESLFDVVLVIVISVYMLLDTPRLARFLRRLFPGDRPEDDLIQRCEKALISYVRGQSLVCLVIGTTAGVGMYILGLIGVFPGGADYALAFGAWAAAVEVVPYIGPWLGAVPPLVVALLHSPSAALAVALVFLFIHQVEGHVVIPKLMGNAVRVHPLVVIFTLLAAGELFGIGGVLICLPLLAVGREVAAFLAERIDFESWRDQVLPLGGVRVDPATAEAAGASEPAGPAESAEVVTQVLPATSPKPDEGEPGHDHERVGKLAPES